MSDADAHDAWQLVALSPHSQEQWWRGIMGAPSTPPPILSVAVINDEEYPAPIFSTSIHSSSAAAAGDTN